MNFLQLFQFRSKAFYLFLIFMAIISSLTNIGILLLVNMALGGKVIPGIGDNGVFAFIVLIILSFLTTTFFQRYMVALTNGVMFNLELSIINKVRRATYESFEKLGPQKIYAAISDARLLSRVPEIFVTLINAGVTIICSLCYLFWVSLLGGVVVMILMLGLLLLYLYRNEKIEKDLNKVRDLQDSYYEALRELLDGFKQIRISFLRNHNLFNHYIMKNRNSSRELSIRASRKYVANELTGIYSWYLVLGVIIFLLPVVFKINISQLTAFITTVLFMMSPVSQLIMFFPFYTAFKIAIERINKIDKQLAQDELPDQQDAVKLPEFESLRFEGVRYTYNADEQTTFELELSDFSILKGETMFITGGNGSGKTTFVNILTGLCKPTGGKCFLNEIEISWDQLSAYANQMAVVYTNQHLFRENYDEHDLSRGNQQLSSFTQMLNLDGVLKIDYEKDRIDRRLSKGQQKRLSLLLSLMENKPIVVLDEWAAEQDPHNRALFYKEWLQTIKQMGKTVIAVSHDDDFYHVADRVVKFNYGKIIADKYNALQETV